MNSKYENIRVPECLDKAIDLGIEKANYEIRNKKYRKNKLVISFSLAFILSIIFLSFNKALAYRIPLVGNVFKMIEKKTYYPNNYSEYATEINQKIYSNGITLTISEVVCDGKRIYVGYIVESDKPFKYPYINESGYFDISQLLLEQEYNRVDFLEEDLDISGLSGIQGEFLDKYTFIGFQRYKFKEGAEVPDKFVFSSKINSIENFDKMESRKKKKIRGNWKFDIPVETNRDLIKDINLENQDVESEFVKINSIDLTEFETEINIEYKNNYNEKQSDKLRFKLRIFNDKNEEVYSDFSQEFENKVIYELESAGLDSKYIKVLIIEELYDLDENGNIILSNGERLGVKEEKIIFDKIISLE